MKTMQIIKVEVTTADGNGTVWEEVEVENYKGFGLEKTKVADVGGMKSTYTIYHMPTGQIIPSYGLTGSVINMICLV